MSSHIVLGMYLATVEVKLIHDSKRGPRCVAWRNRLAIQGHILLTRINWNNGMDKKPYSLLYLVCN